VKDFFCLDSTGRTSANVASVADSKTVPNNCNLVHFTRDLNPLKRPLAVIVVIEPAMDERQVSGYHHHHANKY
jgi:hypothetical protein